MVSSSAVSHVIPVHCCISSWSGDSFSHNWGNVDPATEVGRLVHLRGVLTVDDSLQIVIELLIVSFTSCPVVNGCGCDRGSADTDSICSSMEFKSWVVRTHFEVFLS